MIRVWLSKESTIPMREQLSAQLILGILSRRLPPGERLPSVRELARRLKVHSNTVSAVYRDLAARGWVNGKPGSGVFVRDLRMPAPEGGIDAFVKAWVEDGMARGFSIESIGAALARFPGPANAEPRKLLVVHPDPDFAAILAAEITSGIGSPVPFAGLADAEPLLTPDTCVLATAAVAQQVVDTLRPRQHRVIGLKAMEDVIAGQTQPTTPTLIAVVSRSKSIHQWSQTLLAALGFPGVAVLNRIPGEPAWHDGLGACDIIAADVCAAAELPKNLHAIVFRIISEAFLNEIRRPVAGPLTVGA